MKQISLQQAQRSLIHWYVTAQRVKIRIEKSSKLQTSVSEIKYTSDNKKIL